jgi:hypothetical protein
MARAEPFQDLQWRQHEADERRRQAILNDVRNEQKRHITDQWLRQTERKPMAPSYRKANTALNEKKQLQEQWNRDI